MALSVDEVEELDASELVARLSEETSHALVALSHAERALAWNALPPVAQIVFLTSELEAEVMIGSFVAYFSNPSGAQAALAAKAFRDLGAGALAEVIEQAGAAFAPHAEAWTKLLAAQQENEAPSDTVQLHVPLPGEDALVALTDRFHAVAEGMKPAWGELLETFVDARREELGEWAAAQREY